MEPVTPAAIMEKDGVPVCMEVTEAITIFIALLHNGVNNPEICLSWHQAAKNLIIYTVKAHGIGEYFLDGVSFLQKMCTSYRSLQLFLRGQVWPAPSPPVQLLCQRIAEHSVVTCYSVEGLQEQNRLVIKESVEPRKLDFPTTSLSLTLMVHLDEKNVSEEGTRLTHHLHLMHIINPEIHLKFEIVGPRGKILNQVDYEPEVCKPLFKTPFKLATSLHHYTLQSHCLSLQRGKLRLYRGDSILLPACISLHEGSVAEDILLSCVAALVPHPPNLRAGHRTQADSQCSHINIYIFGPAMAPVVMAGSQTSIAPSLLAEWGQYNLTLRETTRGHHNFISGTCLIPSFCYEVVHSQVEQEQDRVPGGRVLHLFLLLEQTWLGRSGISENMQWAYYIEFMAAIRKSLLTLVSIHSRKFHKAVHSVLNKLLYNHVSTAELSNRVNRVVPAVVEAVDTIIQQSTNQQFKDKCRDLLQVEDTKDTLKRALTNHLWCIAKQKLMFQDLPQRLQSEMAAEHVSGDFEVLGSSQNYTQGKDEECELPNIEVHNPNSAIVGGGNPTIESSFTIEGNSIEDSSGWIEENSKNNEIIETSNVVFSRVSTSEASCFDELELYGGGSVEDCVRIQESDIGRECASVQENMASQAFSLKEKQTKDHLFREESFVLANEATSLGREEISPRVPTMLECDSFISLEEISLEALPNMIKNIPCDLSNVCLPAISEGDFMWDETTA